MWVCLKHRCLQSSCLIIVLPIKIVILVYILFQIHYVFLSAAWDQRVVAVAKGHLPHQVQHNHHIPRHATAGHA